jgi:membrane protein DedA with SNARE-associated domain
MEYLMVQHDAVLYVVLFVSAICENLLPPIPGDTITAFGAFLVGIGRLDFSLVYISTTLGSLAGYMMLFYAGRHFGRDFFIRKNFRFFSRDMIEKAEQRFSGSGLIVVLFNRFMPGIRSVISITSGMLRLTAWKVWCLAAISAAIWNLGWIYAGFMLGDNWQEVKTRSAILLKQYNTAATIIIVSVIILYIIRKLISRRRQRAE